ncbi:hypothetical protein D1007_31182 [Hordeum vulgare]|nr:hypothetical protein D1007_31182 [Hordeum vulgare]
MAGRTPLMKKLRVHAHVGVGGGDGGVGVEVDVLQPDGSAEPPGHRAAAEPPDHRAAAEPPCHQAAVGGSPETRGRHPPPVLVDVVRRSTGRRRLREEIEGEFAVAVHGTDAGARRGGVLRARRECGSGGGKGVRTRSGAAECCGGGGVRRRRWKAERQPPACEWDGAADALPMGPPIN